MAVDLFVTVTEDDGTILYDQDGPGNVSTAAPDLTQADIQAMIDASIAGLGGSGDVVVTAPGSADGIRIDSVGGARLATIDIGALPTLP